MRIAHAHIRPIEGGEVRVQEFARRAVELALQRGYGCRVPFYRRGEVGARDNRRDRSREVADVGGVMLMPVDGKVARVASYRQGGVVARRRAPCDGRSSATTSAAGAHAACGNPSVGVEVPRQVPRAVGAVP